LRIFLVEFKKKCPKPEGYAGETWVGRPVHYTLEIPDDRAQYLRLFSGQRYESGEEKKPGIRRVEREVQVKWESDFLQYAKQSAHLGTGKFNPCSGRNSDIYLKLGKLREEAIFRNLITAYKTLQKQKVTCKYDREALFRA